MDPAVGPHIHPLRIRTITAFLQLPPAEDKWDLEIAAAAQFLSFAKQQLELQGTSPA